MAKVGMGSAKKALFSLEEELKSMSEAEHAKFGDSVFQSLKVKTAKAHNSPLFRAKIFNNRNSNRGMEEDMCADTGCTKPIIRAMICKE